MVWPNDVVVSAYPVWCRVRLPRSRAAFAWSAPG